MLTYRFFPVFFIRAAYATFARSDAALRMAAVHLGRLRVWFGVGAASIGIALLRGVAVR